MPQAHRSLLLFLRMMTAGILATGCAGARAPEQPQLPPLDTLQPIPPRLPPRDTARPPVRLPEPDERALAILPRRRIVAFYGNPRSTRMGILGELPPDRMLQRLDQEVAAWERADPATPVQPALHLIAVMASADPGADRKYRVRMPARVIDQVLGWAQRRRAIVFLDIQPGRSSVREELRQLLPYLRRPEVHLALDPEWAMKEDQVPGRVIGSLDAADVNAATQTLADLVETHGLPPKVLVVHRFTQGMLTNAEDLDVDPRVQLVLNMDGWGPPTQKIAAYRAFVAPAPVPFTGFKIFYRNDRRNGSRLLTPQELLALDPVPFYIQYQ